MLNACVFAYARTWLFASEQVVPRGIIPLCTLLAITLLLYTPQISALQHPLLPVK